MVDKDKVVVFMKGVPEAPQCGFSNAVSTRFDFKYLCSQMISLHIGQNVMMIKKSNLFRFVK